MKRVQTLSPREAYANYILGSVLVDVREKQDVKKSTPDVRQILEIPTSQLGQRIAEIPANRQVILLSHKGVRGGRAAKFLVENGFENVSVVDGGAKAWKEEGLPSK